MDEIIAMILKGIMAEQMFIYATTDKSLLPFWVGDIELSTLEQDALGIDAFVTIKHPHGDIVVPLQIKSSYRGVVQMYLEHPEFWQMRIPILIVRSSDSLSDIRARLERLLRHVYRRGYDFKNFLEWVESFEFDECFKRKIAIWKEWREEALTIALVHEIAKNTNTGTPNKVI